MSIKLNASYCFYSFGKADISNWDHKAEVANGDSHLVEPIQTGGFFAFGIDGVFKGVVIILFMFIAFDAMLLSQWAESVCLPARYSSSNTQPVTIEHFTKTVNQAILIINTSIFLCSLSMAFGLMTIPIHAMVSFDILYPFQVFLFL